MSYLGGDALGGSEYFTGGDCGCANGGTEGGGLFREALTLPQQLIAGNTLAFFTCLTLFGIVAVILSVFVIPGIDTSSTNFHWFAVLTIGVGAVVSLYLESKEGTLPFEQQSNWRR